MAFDAGSIVARMDLDTTDADRKLRDFEKRAKETEHGTHKIKLSAVFDDASVGKARQLFAQLDNALSRDAANRLRSNPQGSVLGTLNALFSPHQVSGGPSAAQSASQGALGKLEQAQDQTVKQKINIERTYDVSGGNAPTVGNQTQDITDKIKVTDKTGIMGRLSSLGGIGGLGGLGGLLGKLGGGGGLLSGGGQLAGGVAGGIGPGILGISTKLLAGLGGVGALLGTLPALGGVAGVGIGVAMIAGLAGVLLAKNKDVKSAFKAMGSQVMATLQQTIQPLVPFILGVIKQIEPLIKSIAPELTSIFKEIGPQIGPIFTNVASIVHDLVSVMAAAAPAFGPFINGLLDLVKNILPPLASGIKSTVPFIGEFGKTLGTVGSDLGAIFNSAGPAIKASMVLLDDLLGLIGSLLPIIGKLGSIFAVALAPAFTEFGHAITALEPVLTIVGQVLGALAGAVIGDLASAFSAVATLIKDMAPGLQIVAKALESMFNVLENSGVFAVLGDVLEKIAPLIAKLVDIMLRQLAPLLPVIIGLIAKFSDVLITLVASGLEVVLQYVIWLFQKMPWLIPVLGGLAAAFWLVNIAMAANPVGAVILGILALIGIIKILADHWSTVWNTVEKVFADFEIWVLEGLAAVVTGFLSFVGTVIQGAADAFGWVPGIGGLLRTAASHFDDFQSGVQSNFQNMINSAQAWRDRLNGAADTAQSTSATVISALQAQGASARTAASDVGGLGAALRKLPKSVLDAIHVSGSGQITVQQQGGGAIVVGASGAYINRGKPGVDDQLAMVQHGELIVPAGMVAAGVVDHLRGAIPGFASGGFVGGLTGLGNYVQDRKETVRQAIAARVAMLLRKQILGVMGGSAGTATPGLMTVARYVLSHGGNLFAAAGIAGTVAGESGGDPESVGTGGAGLIGWTPPSSAYPFLPLVTGNPGRDMGVQLVDMMAYIARNGGIGAINATGSALAAAELFSRAYERPAVLYSDIRPSVVAQIYSALGGRASGPGRGLTGYDSGGWLPPGGANGTGQPEAVLTPAQSSAFLALAGAATDGSADSLLSMIIDRLDTLISIERAAPGRVSGPIAQAMSGQIRRAATAGMYGTR